MITADRTTDFFGTKVRKDKDMTLPYTNKDKIDSLNASSLARFMLYDLPRVLRALDNTEIAFVRWLQLPYEYEDFMVSCYKEYREQINTVSVETDEDVKIYDPATMHVNEDLADRCNHG